ncbi:MAG: tetratricopeptide repeat protein [Desulfovibrionaceae bacterium]|nr:tetratricopeptide repeat protein [Desulfovibrionaceae bacterium]
MSEEKKQRKSSRALSRTNIWLLFCIFVIGIIIGASFFLLDKQSIQQEAIDSPTEAQQGMIDSLITATEIDSKNVLLWVQLGNAYYDTAQVNLAIEAYKKALALNPNMPEVLVDYATMLRANSQLDEARTAYDKALSLSKENTLALYNKGLLLYYDIGNKAEAIATWERLVAQSPHARTPDGRLVQALLTEMKK